jgi:hypothetical protein
MNEGTTPIAVWVLEKEDDPFFTKVSQDVCWIEFGDDNRFKEQHFEPGVWRSLLMSPFNEFFTWQTTVVTEILEQTPDFVRFKTQNSTYKLTHKK